MREEDVLGIVAVPVLRQHGGDFILRILFLLGLWMGDVVIVDDTAVLSGLSMIERTEEVHLVSVTSIIGVYRGTEMGCALIVIVAHSIVVVKVESQPHVFVDVDTKFRIDVVLTMLLVATVVVGNIRVWRQGVHKLKLVRLLRGIAISVGKEKGAHVRTVYENTALTGCVVVAYRIVFSIDTSVVDGILEQVVQRVRDGRPNIAKSTVYCPETYAIRHFFISRCGVVAVGVEIVVVAIFVALGEITVVIQLVIRLSLHDGCRADQQQEQSDDFFHTLNMRNEASANLTTIEMRMM